MVAFLRVLQKTRIFRITALTASDFALEIASFRKKGRKLNEQKAKKVKVKVALERPRRGVEVQF